MRAFGLGSFSAAGVFFVLAFVAAQLAEAATDTTAAADRVWLLACGVAGFLAGFGGARLARAAPLAARYAAAIAGPALLALVFALTSTAQDEAGPWFALAITIGAAALGAFARERIAAAQRRR